MKMDEKMKVAKFGIYIKFNLNSCAFILAKVENCKICYSAKIVEKLYNLNNVSLSVGRRTRVTFTVIVRNSWI